MVMVTRRRPYLKVLCLSGIVIRRRYDQDDVIRVVIVFDALTVGAVGADGHIVPSIVELFP